MGGSSFHSATLCSPIPQHFLPFFLTSCLLSLPPTLAQPRPAAQVSLTINPFQSSGAWDQGARQSLRASFSPPVFGISGTVLLHVAPGPDGRPTQVGAGTPMAPVHPWDWYTHGAGTPMALIHPWYSALFTGTYGMGSAPNPVC